MLVRRKNSASDIFEAGVLIIATILGRPMILGNLYAPLSLILMALLICYKLLQRNFKFPISKDHHFLTYAACMLAFFYILFQGLILSNNTRIVIQDFLFLAFSVTAYYLCFLNIKVRTLFVRYLIILMMGVVLLYLISLLWALMFGWDSIFIAEVDYGYGHIKFGLFYPFTPTYGQVYIKGFYVKRMLGFARESGIMQIFYIWAFFTADFYFKRKKLVKLIMVLGVIFCLSTAGYITFAAALLLAFVLNIKKIVSIRSAFLLLLACLMVYIIFFAPGTSIAYKPIDSLSDRTDAIVQGIEYFLDKPIFGYGYAYIYPGSSNMTGISALSSLGDIGAVGFLLWLNVWFCGFLSSKYKKRFLFVHSSFFITTLFSQPIMYAPVMYWFLFAGCDKFECKSGIICKRSDNKPQMSECEIRHKS